MSNKRIFSSIDQPELGYPDGMCQDTQYGIWSARWGASKVLHFTPDGKLDLIIEFPKALNMTACIFGGVFSFRTGGLRTADTLQGRIWMSFT